MKLRNPLLAFIAVLGFGLLGAAYAIWTLEAQVHTNQSLIKQQQATVTALLDQTEQDRQTLSAQQRLVLALQRQVQQLGGTPLLLPPSPAATPRASGPTAAPGPSSQPRPASTAPTATPGPRPTPKGSPTQSPPSPTPSPSPSPSCRVKVGPICL